MLDERSERNIATLLPPAQQAAKRFLEDLNALLATKGVVAKIISGSRTYEEQGELYAQGRTKPGKIVTNARPGFSNHNFGIAWDIGIFKGGKYLPECPLYRLAGTLGKQQGLEWGGDWESIQDEPHFQLKTGLTLAQMRAKVAAGKSILA